MATACPQALVHPMVEYLNSLRTQERDTNPSNPSYVHEHRRAYLDGLRTGWEGFPAEEELHVHTQLDDFAVALRDGKIDVDAVFLTGDAGDGKTALCNRVAAALAGKEVSIVQPINDVGGWTIVKDASEVRLKEMSALLERHLVERRTEKRLLVAINEGRLRRLFRLSIEARPALRQLISETLMPWLDGARAGKLDDSMARERVLVLNFRHRFHVRAVLPPLFAAWTPRRLWEDSPACSNCPAKGMCPILANAVSLREPRIQERFADVLTAVHFAGQRLPFRRLQALAALACTGGLRCAHVQRDLADESVAPTALLRHRFYEAIFPSTGDNSPVSIQREPLCQSIAALDPGQVTSPALDAASSALVVEEQRTGDLRLLDVCLPPLERVAAFHLSGRLRDSEESDAEDLASEAALFTRSLRRLHAFTGENGFCTSWRRALALLESHAIDESQLDILRTVVGALNRLQRVDGRRDSLTPHQFDPGGFRNPERLALQIDLGIDFECHLARGPVLPPRTCRPWIEGCPSDIRLRAWPRGKPDQGAELSLDLSLVIALLSVDEGFTQHGGLGPYRRDLARFFGQLGALAKAAGNDPAISLRVDGRILRVEAKATTGRLQFLRR